MTQHICRDAHLASRQMAPSSLTIVTHNIWLIPFAGPWMLGRVGRAASHLKQHTTGVGADSLVVAAVQEAWSFRSGLLWPALYQTSGPTRILVDSSCCC